MQKEDAERLEYATIRRHLLTSCYSEPFEESCMPSSSHTNSRAQSTILFRFLLGLHEMAGWLRVKTTAPMTETMISGPLTVLYTGKEHGGTTGVPAQTSMDCTSVVSGTVMALRGTIQCHCTELAHSSLFRHEAEEWLKTKLIVSMNPQITHTRLSTCITYNIHNFPPCTPRCMLTAL